MMVLLMVLSGVPFQVAFGCLSDSPIDGLVG